MAKALGDKHAGIRRYADVLIPMDETLTRVALDASNRPYLVWKVEFSRDKLGDMDTELFKEWFQAFAQNAGLTLHVENLYGENSHHIVESCYKGLARALRAKAIEIGSATGRRGALDQGHAAPDHPRRVRLAWVAGPAVRAGSANWRTPHVPRSSTTAPATCARPPRPWSGPRRECRPSPTEVFAGHRVSDPGGGRIIAERIVLPGVGAFADC